MRYLYLHGFASSPESRKAQAFVAAMTEIGIQLEVPLLDGGDFEHLTISSQLRVVSESLKEEPARLIGSSMGGYLAALYAAAHGEVDRLVLLAPAFHFAARWREMAGPENLRHWEETGWMDIFHYGSKSIRRLHKGLLADAVGFADTPDFRQSTLIFHGLNDDVVPIVFSREFAASHSRSTLRELESDHELTSVLRTIVSEAVPFLIA